MLINHDCLTVTAVNKGACDNFMIEKHRGLFNRSYLQHLASFLIGTSIQQRSIGQIETSMDHSVKKG